jgi:restriction endonuclease S subunit
MKAGWKTVKLGDLTKLITKGTTPTSVGHKFYASGINFVKIESISASGNFIRDRFAHISSECHEALKRSQLQPGDVLFSIAGALGRTVLVTEEILPANTNQALSIIRLKSDAGVHVSYLMKALGSSFVLEQIEKARGGAAQQNLSLAQVREIEIPLPPLAEQKRIVALLDEAFTGIDEAKAKTEANLKKATAVFESHLQSLFAIDNPDWARAKLSSLTTKIGSGATPRGGEESYKDEGVSLIRSLNVHDYGFKYAKLAFLDAVQAEELSGVTVQENDVLLNITGASVARCTIVPRGVLPARVNQHVAIIRPMPEKVSSAFLHYLLISQPYKSRLLETGEEGGSTRQAITKAQLLEFTISHPVSVETQQATAKQLDEVREQTQRLSQLHKQRLDALSALKQSILSQAFAGELTA